MCCPFTARQKHVAEEKLLEPTHAARETARGTAVAFRVAEVTIRNLLLGFVVASLASCGSSDKQTTPISAISGTVTPPTAPGSAPPVTAIGSPPTNMLLAPSALPASFPAIAQSAEYGFERTGSSLAVTSVVFRYPLDLEAYFEPLIIGSDTVPGDASLGKPNPIMITTNVWTGVSGTSTFGVCCTVTFDVLGGLPDLVDTSVNEAIAYVLPYSAAVNPAGYTYQTFGTWIAVPDNLPPVEGYFSTGIPTDAATLPVAGTATYTGPATGTWVNAQTRDFFSTVASVNVTVDFGASTVTISTTGTNVVSNNAPPGTSPTPSANLNFSGSLSYSTASNTFTGVATTSNGISGNVTGRFYGLGISASTSSKVMGSPPELGGTFAVFVPGGGSMQGAFGSN